MNRQTAIGLIVGFVFALITAFTTSKTFYYVNDRIGNSHEINKESYNKRIYPNGKQAPNRLQFRKEVKYNPTFIIVALIGGIGLGYILSEKIESK